MIGIDYFATTGQVIMISTWGLLRKYEEKFSHKKTKKKTHMFFLHLVCLVIFCSRHNNTDYALESTFNTMSLSYSCMLTSVFCPHYFFIMDMRGHFHVSLQIRLLFLHNVIRLGIKMPCN